MSAYLMGVVIESKCNAFLLFADKAKDYLCESERFFMNVIVCSLIYPSDSGSRNGL